MVYLFLAEGFEEVEAITPFDYLKRAGFNVKTIGVGSEKIKGSHNLEVTADLTLENFNETLNEEDLIILPGGLKGTENLYNNEKVLKYVKKAASVASIAAICAAPSILGKLGLLKKIKACCYPGFEKFLEEAEISNENVVISKNIITSRGAGTAQQFSFKIIEYLVNKNKAEEIKKEVQWKV